MKKNIKIPKQNFISVTSTCGNSTIEADDFDSIKKGLMLSREQERRFNAIIKKYKLLLKKNRNVVTDTSSDLSCSMVKITEIIAKQNSEIALVLNDEQFLLYKKSIKVIENKYSTQGYSEDLMNDIISKLRLNEETAGRLIQINTSFEKLFSDARLTFQNDEVLAEEYWNMYDAERKCAVKLILSEYQFLKYLKLVAKEAYKNNTFNRKKTKYNLC